MDKRILRIEYQFQGGLIFFNAITFALFFLIQVSLVSGQSYDTRFTSSIYSWTESYDGTERDHLRGYQSGSLTLRDVGIKRLKIKSYFYVSDDFSEDTEGGTYFKMYDLYADYRRAFNFTDVRFGRQFIFAGVGRGPMDGLQLTYKGWKNGNVRLYAGTLAPLSNPETIDSWDESNIFGGELTIFRLMGNVLKLSFVRRSKNIDPFALDSPRLGISSINPISLQRQAAGFNLTRNINKNIDLFMRGDFSVGEGVIDENIALERGEIILTQSKPKSHYLTFELSNRRPLVYVNSFFSRFTNLLRRSSDLSLAFDRKVSNDLWLNIKTASVLYGEGVNSFRFNGGFTFNKVSSGLVIRRGYGGNWTGIYGGYYGKISRKLSLRVDGEWSDFSITSFDLDDNDNSTAISLRTGINLRFNRRVSIDGELQSLSQSIEWRNIADVIPFAGNDRELRVFFKLNLWFFKGEGY